MFSLSQHSRDVLLVKSRVDYLKCGNVSVRTNKLQVDFTVGKLEDNLTKIIPLLEKHSLKTGKHKDFLD